MAIPNWRCKSKAGKQGRQADYNTKLIVERQLFIHRTTCVRTVYVFIFLALKPVSRLHSSVAYVLSVVLAWLLSWS